MTAPNRVVAEESIFDHVWRILARNGVCDSRGSVEYCRVKRDWLTFACALYTVDFIRSETNATAGGDE